jgi:endogenous inhibitor of DNA gyrase (YacG/DUF329 family)
MTPRELAAHCANCHTRLPQRSRIYANRDADGNRPIIGHRPAYQKYNPFCSLRCALEYARRAYDNRVTGA